MKKKKKGTEGKPLFLLEETVKGLKIQAFF